jgi:integrase
MAEALATLLEEYLATWQPNPEGSLFLNRNGRPYAGNKVVEYGLWPVLDKLKVPRAGMHAFGHCHASLLMDVGANPTVTKVQMRHSDARITLGVYGHVIGDSQRDAVDKVGEILAQVRPSRRRQVSTFNNLRNAGYGFDSHRPLQSLDDSIAFTRLSC